MPASIRPTSVLKAQLMQPATTSNFECYFYPPPLVVQFMEKRFKAGAGPLTSQFDKINISCCEASLPGSTLQTGQMTDSYTGVTETYAYRRAYDNRADFTFYVDSIDSVNRKGYNVILFFENWIAYAAGEDAFSELAMPNYYYRMNFPDYYMTNALYISKFEKDAILSQTYLNYKFINAYPISINSMPVSYEGSQVLKCTVSFSYQRYTVKLETGVTLVPSPSSTSTPTNSQQPPANPQQPTAQQSAPPRPTVITAAQRGSGPVINRPL